MRRVLIVLIGLAIIGLAAFWGLTMPERIDPARLATVTGDAERGARVFTIGGCASCHAAKDASEQARLDLMGGQRFATPFGTFLAPNISTDPTHGLGAWDLEAFASAMLHGTAPDGRHYFPAFPYTSYARMPVQDIADLWAYMQTLPANATPNAPHELDFPFNIRRGLGLWKRLYLDPSPVLEGDLPEDVALGRAITEGPGHCAECHTPRDAFGGPDRTRWMAGGPNPEGRGRIPNITPGGKNVSGWSAADIAEYLSSGFTPDYDTAGGTMVEVIENTSRLTDVERAAIAAYLKAIPTVPN